MTTHYNNVDDISSYQISVAGVNDRRCLHQWQHYALVLLWTRRAKRTTTYTHWPIKCANYLQQYFYQMSADPNKPCTAFTYTFTSQQTQTVLHLPRVNMQTYYTKMAMLHSLWSYPPNWMGRLLNSWLNDLSCQVINYQLVPAGSLNSWLNETKSLSN